MIFVILIEYILDESHKDCSLEFLEIYSTTFILITKFKDLFQTLTIYIVNCIVCKQVFQLITINLPITIFVKQLEHLLQVIYLEKLLFLQR